MAFARRIDPAHGHGGIGRRAKQALDAGSLHIGIGNLRQHKGAAAGGKQMADAVDQIAVATVVGVQGIALLGGGVGSGGEVSMNVSTAKTVDGLLGVAHQKYGHALADKGGVENGVLQRVSVLEFVDERHAPFGLQGLGERFGLFGMLGVGQSGMHVEQQIIIVAARAAAFVFGQTGFQVAQTFELEADGGFLLGFADFGQAAAENGQGLQGGDVGFFNMLVFPDFAAQGVVFKTQQLVRLGKHGLRQAFLCGLPELGKQGVDGGVESIAVELRLDAAVHGFDFLHIPLQLLPSGVESFLYLRQTVFR